MDKKFTTYTLYLDSDHSTTNFNTIDELKEHAAELMSVTKDRVVLENDVDVNGHSNISVKDKFGDQIRVFGFVYGSVW